MTAILGLIGDDGCAYVGADSAAVDGWAVDALADAKVFKRSGLVFACTTSFRFRDLLRYKLKIPKPPHLGSGTIECWIRTAFIDAVRECLTEGGWMKKENEREEAGLLVLGVPSPMPKRDRLFLIDGDLCVLEPRDRIITAGGGRMPTIAAAQALIAYGHARGPQLIKRSLKAATYALPYIRPPFTVKKAG